MRNVQVESQAIQSFGYDTPTATLQVTFRSGRPYNYFGVPASLVGRLVGAPSAGSFFSKEIRNAFPCSPVAA
jgi:hypothetical protein